MDPPLLLFTCFGKADSAHLRDHGRGSCPAAPDASSARRARHLRVPHGRNRVLGRLSWWPSASRAQEAQLDALIPPDDTCLRTWETSAVAVCKSWCSSDGVRRFGAAPPHRLPLSDLSPRHQCVLRLTLMCRRSPALGPAARPPHWAVLGPITPTTRRPTAPACWGRSAPLTRPLLRAGRCRRPP